jgi:hypothetical protein
LDAARNFAFPPHADADLGYDEMRVVDASEAWDSFTLTLEHLEDRSPGTAIIGKEFGVVTEFSYGGTKVVLENLRSDYADAP